MKYYVVSGELKRIVTATSPIEAAVIATMRFADGEMVGTWFAVDERGFRDPSGFNKPETLVPYDVVCGAYDAFYNDESFGNDD